ncbi:hypothetical protein F7D01_04300 [Erythrobacter sp. 3-20A1M]|uniref:RcnB family protein n=1 Tax=Erythrobacter sp. 3-20A1M TaxID=2653850 RepID=UPI001BFC68E9|nr:hypothetical protein F7D01_04300 [Erythrobacter sp. 3-20A1M]
MKKTLIPLVAALSLAVPGMAQARDHYRDRGHHRTEVTRVVVKNDRGNHYGQSRYVARRHWQRGQRFDRRYAPNYRVVNYRDYRGLRAPPRGYQYVRSGNDVLLVGITSGIIGAVIGGLIR